MEVSSTNEWITLGYGVNIALRQWLNFFVNGEVVQDVPCASLGGSFNGVLYWGSFSARLLWIPMLSRSTKALAHTYPGCQGHQHPITMHQRAVRGNTMPA